MASNDVYFPGAGSRPTTVTIQDGGDVTLGSTTDLAVDPSLDATAMSRLRQLSTDLNQFITQFSDIYNNGVSSSQFQVDVTSISGISVSDTTPLPIKTAGVGGWSLFKSSVAEASHIIKGFSAVVRAVMMYNGNASTRTFQMFSSGVVPVDATVPDWLFPVVPGTLSGYDFGVDGIVLSSGVTVCNSTTIPTKTLGSADSYFWVIYK